MPREVYLYNTLTRKKEKLEPLDSPKVGLYTCGPTVYNYAHIGNLRTYFFEDILKRTLKYAEYQVNHVMNITDVGHLVSDADEGEDKMEKGARREGKTAWDIAKRYTDAFIADLHELNIIEPDKWCKATDHITEMIDMVKEIEAKGAAYRAEDGIYFDTAKFADYGKMALLDIDNLEAGKRIDLKDKKNHTDFALWKFSPTDNKKRDMEWDSPWGIGFPGWHIECSAMSMKYLGNTFDIHCGGKDHIQVHHTNEIAQSEMASGHSPFVRVWLHGEFLKEDKGKMSKSGENFLTLPYLVSQGYHSLDYRYLMLQAHYRSELNFHYEAMDSAKAGRNGIKNLLSEWNIEDDSTPKVSAKMYDYQEEFGKALFDDLNSPKAMAVFHEVLKDASLNGAEKKHLIFDFDKVLGLDLEKELSQQQNIDPEILKMIQERDDARQNKEWALSDQLRDEIQARGYQVKDSPEGTKVFAK